MTTGNQTPPPLPGKTKKKLKAWHIILIIFGGFIVLIILCSIPKNPTSSLSQNPVVTQTSKATTAPLPTQTQRLGYTRSSPLPYGSVINTGGFTIQITEVVVPADAIVAAGNMFNSTPDPGMEYVQIKVELICTRSSNMACSFSTIDFSLIDSGGVVHDYPFVSGVANKLESGEFYGGATKSGYLFFTTPIGDRGLVLKYSELFGAVVYLSVY
jgi:hypothetical protein